MCFKLKIYIFNVKSTSLQNIIKHVLDTYKNILNQKLL